MVSVVIVNYQVKEELFACIKSLIASKPKTPYEIIVVDNDEEKTIAEDLQKQFPKVIYIQNENKGYGQGNNIGAKHAKGEYLFFLNPDTITKNNSIDILTGHLNKNKETGIIAPLLLDKNTEAYPLQGIKELNPLRAIFALSFVNKILPKNKIYQEYYLSDWNKESIKEVDAVPGTAFMIRKKLFEEIGGFDEKYFLYFEEFDLCKRVREKDQKVLITPEAHIIHHWGVSTKKSKKNIQQIFKHSRFYYFRKHFGIIAAIMTETVLRMNKYNILLTGVVLLSLFLSLYNLQETMSFIGDQGWFYMSARDMVLTGNIPLVGIASSHPWLHQGALWTYMLGGMLPLFSFNPFSGAYITIVLHVITIVLMYKFGAEMFSKTTGLIAAALYATSPLVVMTARTPYHTSPIPLFTLIFLYALYKWIQGNTNFFPVIILTLTILYNLELATVSLWVVLFILIAYGLWQKKRWVLDLRNKKIMILTVLAFVIPMMPVLMYDFQNNFPQTVGFAMWIGYKVLVFFGYPPLHPEIPSQNLFDVFSFSATQYIRLIFIENFAVALLIFILSFVYLCKEILHQIVKRKYKASYLILGLVLAVSLFAFFAIKTASDAYLPIFFPTIILVNALWLAHVIQTKKPAVGAIIILILICFINAYTLVANNYSYDKAENGITFPERLNIARKIIKETDGKEYNIIGRGEGSKFRSFTMNYEYLTLWLGHGPAERAVPLRFVISEADGNIHLRKEVSGK